MHHKSTTRAHPDKAREPEQSKAASAVLSAPDGEAVMRGYVV